MRTELFDLHEQPFSASPLHASDRNWIEGNCYTDMWIALLHTLNLEPTACLGPALAAGYGADQWTFFKPSHADLYRLYGVIVEEMSVWQDLLDHCRAHVSAGQIPLVEVDAFYLPDAIQTDYRTHHSKTTIAVNRLDPTSRELGYFHNAGYFRLQGDDFDGIFKSTESQGSTALPPYCETVKLTHMVSRPFEQLRELAREMARIHYSARPRDNPMPAFAMTLEETIAELAERDEASFHAWVFATIRQMGAGLELAAIHLRWLALPQETELLCAADHFSRVAETAKMLVMKTARMAVSGKLRPLATPLTEMENNVSLAYALLDEYL